MRIKLDVDDYVLMLEVNRMGTATLDQITFVTGDLTGMLEGRLDELIAMGVMEAVVNQGVTFYMVTAEGLFAAFQYDSYHRALTYLYNGGVFGRRQVKRLLLRQSVPV